MEDVTITVTLNQKLMEELRCIAGPNGPSSFVSDLVRQHLQAIRLRKMLKEMEAEAGPISPEVQAEVDSLEWPD
jgi:hypothetical protein